MRSTLPDTREKSRSDLGPQGPSRGIESPHNLRPSTNEKTPDKLGGQNGGMDGTRTRLSPIADLCDGVHVF